MTGNDLRRDTSAAMRAEPLNPDGGRELRRAAHHPETAFRVAPRPGGEITHARTDYDSPHGRIEVAWRLEEGTGSIDVTVPPGTEADVVLPDGRTALLAPGHHRLGWSTR